MTHMIRLEKWVTSKDGSGNNIEEVTEKINLFAEVKRLSGDRASLNGVTNLDNFFQFIVRFTPSFNITGNWRVIYGGNYFTVHSIERMQEKRFYWIIKGEAKGKKKVNSNVRITEDGRVVLTEDNLERIIE